MEAISTPNKAYISAISPSGVTVSGPPKTLQRLFESSDPFRGSHHLQTQIIGPYHAAHLHSDSAVQEILCTEDLEIDSLLASTKPTVPIFSASKGKCYSATTMAELLEQTITDVLLEHLNFNLILHECIEAISATDGKCRVVPIGPTNASASIVSAIQSKPSTNVSLFDWELGQEEPGRRGSASLRSSKIAIVGMSGRFPGGSDVEEFWQVLQKGLDMHKEVIPFNPQYLSSFLTLRTGPSRSIRRKGSFRSHRERQEYEPHTFRMLH
jgi:hypothetical protein